MTTLVDNLRGTLAGVLGATTHLAWYMDWTTGNHRCARTSAHDPRAGLIDRR